MYKCTYMYLHDYETVSSPGSYCEIGQLLSLGDTTSLPLQTACKMAAIALHYFCTSLFLWMFAEGANLYRQIVKVYGSENSWMKYYYAACYGRHQFLACHVILCETISGKLYWLQMLLTPSYLPLTQYTFKFTGLPALIVWICLAVRFDGYGSDSRYV